MRGVMVDAAGTPALLSGSIETARWASAAVGWLGTVPNESNSQGKFWQSGSPLPVVHLKTSADDGGGAIINATDSHSSFGTISPPPARTTSVANRR